MPAKNVARKTYRDVRPYYARDDPVAEQLADQLLLPMGPTAAQKDDTVCCEFVTRPLSLHVTTNISFLILKLP